MIFLKLVPALFCGGRTIVNIYISVVVWGMHEQYACAVLIEWLVVECSRCKCSVCVSLGAIVSVINGHAWTVP